MIHDLVLLSDLAEELGLDRSHARKIAIATGLNLIKVRTLKTRGSKTLALSVEEAETFKKQRRSEFAGEDCRHDDAVEGQNTTGALYIVQLVPDLTPLRVKLGYTASITARLNDHRTAAPTAQLCVIWKCKPAWEACAIASITRVGCVPLSNEVYDCDSLEELKERGNAFFALMPLE